MYNPAAPSLNLSCSLMDNTASSTVISSQITLVKNIYLHYLLKIIKFYMILDNYLEILFLKLENALVLKVVEISVQSPLTTKFINIIYLILLPLLEL